MKWMRMLSAGTLALVTSLGVVGCEEGTFEDSGEEIDEAVEEIEDEVDDATDDN